MISISYLYLYLCLYLYKYLYLYLYHHLHLYLYSYLYLAEPVVGELHKLEDAADELAVHGVVFIVAVEAHPPTNCAP